MRASRFARPKTDVVHGAAEGKTTVISKLCQIRAPGAFAGNGTQEENEPLVTSGPQARFDLVFQHLHTL